MNKDNIQIESIIADGQFDNNNSFRQLDNNNNINKQQEDEIINKLPDWNIEPPIEIKRGNE